MPLQDLVQEDPIEKAADRHAESEAAHQPKSLPMRQGYPLYHPGNWVGHGTGSIRVTNFQILLFASA